MSLELTHIRGAGEEQAEQVMRLFGNFFDDKRAIKVLVLTMRGPFCRQLVAT